MVNIHIGNKPYKIPECLVLRQHDTLQTKSHRLDTNREPQKIGETSIYQDIILSLVDTSMILNRTGQASYIPHK